MAVSRIEEKILGRLARHSESSIPALSSSIYQVLGLSILLSRSVAEARKYRKLETTTNATSQKLSHHIIWLAREGLATTEVNILPYCQNGEQGPEYRVMAAKLRASFYHVFCLFHNYPAISQMASRTNDSASTPTSVLSPLVNNGQTTRSPETPSKNGKANGERSRRPGKASLRDPIPSATSDASYITNPYAGVPTQTPPPAGPPPPIPPEMRRTPTRPPGLSPIDVTEAHSTAAFLLSPSNFVPWTLDHFETAQRLATTLLPPSHALRLSLALEYALFLGDCAKDQGRSRKLARRTMKEVYDSSEGLNDEEFEDAKELMRSLGGVVRRDITEPTPQPSLEQIVPPRKPVGSAPHIDRTIAVSPPQQQQQQTSRGQSPNQMRTLMRTPERLSTVLEVESVDANGDDQVPPISMISPPVSRLSSRSRQRRTPSATSDRAIKRRAAEQVEELRRRNSAGVQSAGSGSGSGGAGSRQGTPPEGYVRKQPRRRPSRNGNRSK